MLQLYLTLTSVKHETMMSVNQRFKCPGITGRHRLTGRKHALLHTDKKEKHSVRCRLMNSNTLPVIGLLCPVHRKLIKTGKVSFGKEWRIHF